jgi:hypothetical protein
MEDCVHSTFNGEPEIYEYGVENPPKTSKFIFTDNQDLLRKVTEMDGSFKAMEEGTSF